GGAAVGGAEDAARAGADEEPLEGLDGQRRHPPADVGGASEHPRGAAPEGGLAAEGLGPRVRLAEGLGVDGAVGVGALAEEPVGRLHRPRLARPGLRRGRAGPERDGDEGDQDSGTEEDEAAGHGKIGGVDGTPSGRSALRPCRKYACRYAATWRMRPGAAW